jgi:hypothetical protein
MIGKEFDAIVKEDIDALVQNAVCERRDTEYKQQLPGGSDEEAREFLADVSSLANASGGDLIYGVRDKRDDKGQPTGIPEAVDGLGRINSDAEERRLLNMLRDGIDPRIPGTRIKHLDGYPSGPVIVLRVLKSWASPHMVKFKNLSRFFSRTSAGKYQLDVREIRAAFTASESLVEKISAFRSDRVGKILAGETPVPLEPGPKFVLHLLPVRSFAEPAVVDLRTAQSTIGENSLVPMGPKADGWGPVQFNFNGLLCNSGSGGSPRTGSYVQIFRNGAIEAVCTWLATSPHRLVGSVLDQELVRAVPQYTNLQRQLGIGFPMFIAISAVSVKGFWIARTPNPNPHELGWNRPIDREVLVAPEVFIEEGGGKIERLLRPALDTIWQASGWPGSQGYDESGEYVGFVRFLRT